MKCFKDIIRQERVQNKILLREVAAVTKIDQTIINKFELGERIPTRLQVVKLAEFYKLDVNELIVSWKSDIIASELLDEKYPLFILELAKEKLSSIK
jgi:transcriptional regulator with XRE-family HTH domain